MTKTAPRVALPATNGSGPAAGGRPRTPPATVDGHSPTGWPGLGPFGLSDHDGPETIRLRKYTTGTHVVLEQIDVEMGVSPREVVWSHGATRLYRYHRQASTSDSDHRVPLLLLYGFVLKSTILDLVPGNSLVEYLVARGFDVFLLDLGITGNDDADLSVEDLVLDHIPDAVDAVRTASGAEQVSIVGVSQGGTLAVIHAALANDDRLRNLVLVSTPTEFAPRRPGPLGWWTLASRNGEAVFDPAVVPRYLGNLPTGVASAVIGTAASLQAISVQAITRALGGGVGYDAGLAEIRKLADRDVAMRSWLAVSRWVDDAAPFPGVAFHRWVRDFYQRNELVAGRVRLRGHRVDLTDIQCALLNVSGRWDHIVPLSQTTATTQLVSSSDVTSISHDAGHVGILAGPSAMTSLWPRVGDWLAARSR